MPVLFTDFIIRQPRVSTLNSVLTLPPSSSGSWGLLPGISVQYTGAGATSAIMTLTAKNIYTLINNDLTHSDNLNITLTGQELSNVVTSIQANSNYAVTLLGNATDLALFEGFNATSILTPITAYYGYTAEFLIQAQNTAKLGSALVNYLKDEFTYSQTARMWQYNSGEVPTVSSILVPSSGVTPIENGAYIDFVANPNSPTYDIALTKTETDQTLINNATQGTQFINFSVLPYVLPGTLSLVINGTPAIEGINYEISTSSNRINFLNGVNNELHTLTSDVSNVTTNVQGVNGVITDSFVVTRNGNPLVENVDYIPSVTSSYQDENVGPGTIYFTQTYTDDPVAEYVLGVEESLLTSNFMVYLNGVLLDPSQYIIVLEAGFLNLNTKCFPGDVVTVSYISQKFGQINNEIVAGTAAAITGINTGPFMISAGVNDTFSVFVDGAFTDTATLPVGGTVSLSDIVTSYNSQAIYSLMTTTTDGSNLIVASITGGPESMISILDGDANSTLGFTQGQSASGTGAVGGEFAFTLANAPVEINSFSVPQGGDTFIISEHNVLANYPVGAVVQLNADLYIVESSTTSDQAFLYSSNPSNPSLLTFAIAEDTNDQFILTVDGSATYTITLTPGQDQTVQDIVDDINLIVNIASAVPFNGTTKILLTSPTVGIGGSITIGNGTANQTLGFTNGQQATGLTDTIVTITGEFVQGYSNPTLSTTRTPVTFITETSQQDKSPQGVASVTFNGVNVTAHYQPDVFLQINNSSIYTVLGSSFQNNQTVVNLQKPLAAPLFQTDVISYTNRPVYTEGDTTISLRAAPIQNLPIIVYNNGNPLTLNTDYTVTQDGRIRLTQPLNPSMSITATYTTFQNFNAGDVISLSYTFFSSINQGSVVTASYQYTSPDQFFVDVVYQSTLSDALIAAIEQQTQQLQNPSSSGFTVGSGGSGTPNDQGGAETPSLTLDDNAYDDDIAKKIYDFFDNRITAFTNEQLYYTGEVIGGNNGSYNGAYGSTGSQLASGPVTEANIQDIVNSPTRLFPQSYTKTTPLEVPALLAENLNDDGTSTGGTNAAENITTYTSAEYTDISNETTYLDDLLAIPLGSGPVTLTGSVAITSVDFYTGPSPAENNVFVVTVNGTQYTITFTASAIGTATTLSSILSQINAVVPSLATSSANKIVLTASTGLLIGSGSANTTLGFTSGQTSTTREGSTAYASWRALVADEINQINSEITILNDLVTALETQMQEWLSPYDEAFTEASTQLTIVQTFLAASEAALTQDNTDYNMSVQVNSNITTRRDTTNPARQTAITTFVDSISNRLSQISASLTRENLIASRFSWLTYRANRTTGTVISYYRAYQNQLANAANAANNQTMSNSSF